MQGTIYPNASYAKYVHEGRGTSRKYGRRPFMEDAAKDTIPFIEKELKSQMTEELNRVASRTNIG